MDKITHEMRMTNWTKLIQDCLSSGLSKKEWCRQNHVNEKTLYYWQRKAREKAYASQVTEKQKPVNYEVGFVELPSLPKVQEPITSSISAKVLVHGCTIEIADSASNEFLHRLLGALTYVQ